MNKNTIFYDNTVLLRAMKEAINACRTKGWNFNGAAQKAKNLQLVCEKYEKNANSQFVEEFILLASEARPFFSFSLFGHKFEFWKASFGNTNSAKCFNKVLDNWADSNERKEALGDERFSSSYIRLTKKFDNACFPKFAKKDLSLEPNHYQKNSEMCNEMQERHYPPLGLMDTMIGGKSAHGQGDCFLNDEIVKKIPVVRRKKLTDNGNSIYARYTVHNKAIIQQQGVRGCTAAVAAMLILDYGKQPRLRELAYRNLGNAADIIRDIEHAGLTPALIAAPKNLAELRSILLANGPAITSIDDPEIHGHVIVVDEVSEDLSCVRLRDPYHGLEITVKADAFLRRNSPLAELIQVKQDEMAPSRFVSLGQT